MNPTTLLKNPLHLTAIAFRLTHYSIMSGSADYNYTYILRLSITAALGGLLFGYDISVISGTIPFITDFFSLNEWWKGFIVSGLYIGCIVGAALAGRTSDGYGRKKMLIIAAILFAISAAGSG